MVVCLSLLSRGVNSFDSSSLLMISQDFIQLLPRREMLPGSSHKASDPSPISITVS